ncbi:MAG: serine hydrolase domain-containing protein [Gemmatimonadota bacterium]
MHVAPSPTSRLRIPSWFPPVLGLLLSVTGPTPIRAAISIQDPGEHQDVTLSTGTPEEVGMSSAILQSGVQLFRDAIEAGDLVGAVILVAKDGKVVLHEAIGWRHTGRDLPMEMNTMFRMASNTKPTIATAVGILVEEGELAYDDPVREHIPSFDNYRSGFIQIRHLLNHSSGFRISSLFLEPYMEPSPEHPDAPTLQLEAARFGEVGAEVLPGTSYSYSNPGYNTLGALVEMASGQSLESFLDERIYTPLGMNDSYHHEVAEKLDGKLNRMGAVYYQQRDGGWVPGWEPGNEPQVPFVRASGGMISTAPDYAIFCQMFLNGGVYGGVRILEEETVQTMTSDTYFSGGEFDPERGARVGYGYGWNVAADGTFSHTGSDGTGAWVDPNQDLIVLVFTQTPRGRKPRGKFLELVRAAILD